MHTATHTCYHTSPCTLIQPYTPAHKHTATHMHTHTAPPGTEQKQFTWQQGRCPGCLQHVGPGRSTVGDTQDSAGDPWGCCMFLKPQLKGTPWPLHQLRALPLVPRPCPHHPWPCPHRASPRTAHGWGGVNGWWRQSCCEQTPMRKGPHSRPQVDPKQRPRAGCLPQSQVPDRKGGQGRPRRVQLCVS